MKEEVYVDRLFADYEDTQEIRDFKEEIVGNLKERIRELRSKGLDEERAFEKATAELGDITAIADGVGRRKRNEAICRMYTMSKVPVTKRTAAGLTIASGMLLTSIGLTIIMLFSDIDIVWPYYLAAALFAAALGTYVYFGLTQETSARYQMKNGRAAAYGIAFAMAVIAVALGIVTYFFSEWELYVALGIETILLVVAVCALIFMLATESDRKKPWLKEMTEQEFENSMKFEEFFSDYTNFVDPVKAARFGVASGGLWLFALVLFFTLWLAVEWQYPWLVFLFAIPVQVAMAGMIFGRKNTA